MEGVHLGRAGEQQVFHGRSLKNAVVGKVKQRFRLWNVAGDAYARTPGGFVGGKTVLVETQAGADAPIADVESVLNIERGLGIPFAAAKGKLQESTGIELRRIGDVI